MIPGRFPCNKNDYNLNLTHILPATWSNLKSFKFQTLEMNKYPMYSNVNV